MPDELARSTRSRNRKATRRQMRSGTVRGSLLRKHIREIRWVNPKEETHELIPSTRVLCNDWRRQQSILRAAFSSQLEGRPASGFRAFYKFPNARRLGCVDRDCRVSKSPAERELAQMFREYPIARFVRDTSLKASGNSPAEALRPNVRAISFW